MALSAVRARTSLLPSGPVSEPTSIRSLLGDYGDQINLRPIYQRDIRWNKDNMCQLIGTVMNQALIPGLILYKLQAEERSPDSPFRYEMVDGQHRYFTLHKFFKGELVTELEGKPFLITWIYRTPLGREIHVLYKENETTKEWATVNPHLTIDYMTEDEQDAFNTFKIDKKEIKDALTIDKRREIFQTLQRGIPVRNSDLLKNKVNIRLIRLIVDEMLLEHTLKNFLKKRCWLYTKNYWLNWAVRLYLVVNPIGDKSEEDMFAIRDTQIKEWINKGSPNLNTTPEGEEDFKDVISRFFSFLDALPKGIKLSPCHFYALFAHLVSADEGREEILAGHIKDWTSTPQAKIWNKAWENRKNGNDDDERKAYFAEIYDDIEKIQVAARPEHARKSIPKLLREEVWKKYFGDKLSGNCFCCDAKIQLTKDYEACHLIAYKYGGPDTLANLRPGCRSCNGSMRTQNMLEFKRQYYPDIHTPLSLE